VRYTETDWPQLSWHDCHVWGMEFRVGDAVTNDWTSDLVVQLDFITEWLCGVDGGAQFRVAPAELVFHGTSDPRTDITWDGSGAQVAMHLLSIDHIDRQPIEQQRVFLDRPYYRWDIRLNWPAGGRISFGAAGFTQTLLAEPQLSEHQHFTRLEREALLRKG
jgi:hypothetical protein